MFTNEERIYDGGEKALEQYFDGISLTDVKEQIEKSVAGSSTSEVIDP